MFKVGDEGISNIVFLFQMVVGSCTVFAVNGIVCSENAGDVVGIV